MFEQNGCLWDCNATVAAGASNALTFILPERGAPLSVAVKPSYGATARVEFCVCSRQVLRAGQAIWLDWPLGEVTSAAGIDTLAPTTAFRVTSTGGNTQVQISQGEC